MKEPPEDDSVAELISAQEDLGIDTMEYDDEYNEIQDAMSTGGAHCPPPFAVQYLCKPRTIPYFACWNDVAKVVATANGFCMNALIGVKTTFFFHATTPCAGRLVGEALLLSEYALPESAATQSRVLSPADTGESMHATDSNLHASGPFSRPVTPMHRSVSRRHAGHKDARRDVAQSDGALTMRARAEKAAEKAALHVVGNNTAKQEYVTAFAGKELARTPPHGPR
jgi:hypothetical protein